MDISNKRTDIMVIIALLWLVISVLGWYGHFMPAMYLGVVLMLLHMVMGVAKKGKVSNKLLSYPLLAWAVLWALSFFLSKHFADAFAGQVPSFTILGFHPSFAWTVLTYWLGGMFTLNLGFVLFKNEWLTEKEWDEFVEKVKSIKEAA